MGDKEQPVIDDPQTAINELERMWEVNPPQRYDNTPEVPLLGSERDQVSTTDNPYWEIVRRLPLDRLFGYQPQTAVQGWTVWGGEYVMTRDRLVSSYAWSIPTPSDLEWLKTVVDGKSVVEVGAGTGYWAWQLAQVGVDVAGFDAKPGEENTFCGSRQFHRVERGGPEAAAEFADRALFLCWPPYATSMAADVLAAYRGDLLIYAGEGVGGCCGDDDFHELVGKEWEEVSSAPGHATFGGIHCWLTAYRRVEVAS